MWAEKTNLLKSWIPIIDHDNPQTRKDIIPIGYYR